MSMKHTKTLAIAAVLLGVWLYAPSADAEQVHYVSVHPIPAHGDQAEAFCHIQVPHVHVYEPAQKNRKVLYRQEGDAYHFVGDPVAHGYDGPRHPYYGHHPVVVDMGVHVDVDVSGFDDEYCYIDGPHHHGYQPPPSATFELKGDAYWYVGKYPRKYRKHKKRYAPINTVYAPMTYERPVVVVDARPAAYVGPIVEIHTPGVVVETPHAHADVEVVVPAPSVHLEIGLPGVSVGHRHYRHKKHKKFKKHRKFRKHRKFKRSKRRR